MPGLLSGAGGLMSVWFFERCVKKACGKCSHNEGTLVRHGGGQAMDCTGSEAE